MKKFLYLTVVVLTAISCSGASQKMETIILNQERTPEHQDFEGLPLSMIIPDDFVWNLDYSCFVHNRFGGTIAAYDYMESLNEKTEEFREKVSGEGPMQLIREDTAIVFDTKGSLFSVNLTTPDGDYILYVLLFGDENGCYFVSMQYPKPGKSKLDKVMRDALFSIHYDEEADQKE